MESRKYKFREANGAYFISFATVYWIDVFTRVDYFDMMIESLDYCRKQKGLELYAYCIMPSHGHLLFRSSLGNPSGLIRDLKGFTSKKMLKAIEENPKKAEKNGYFVCLKKRVRKIAMYNLDNFGNKIINQLKYGP